MGSMCKDALERVLREVSAESDEAQLLEQELNWERMVVLEAGRT